MFSENPQEIQEAPGTTHSTPLILTHDGGGTAYEYHFLGPLDRAVWGITNPRFDSCEPWAGGISEQAAHYITLIRRVVPSGPIILGGWSLGGLLSFEMAWQLRDDEKLRVKGIVMVDSVFPKFDGVEKETGGKAFSNWTPTFNSYTTEATKKSVVASFANTFEALKTWSPPDWEKGSEAAELPKTMLLRCKHAVKTEDGSLKRVDTYRHKPLLGWEGYGHKFIDGVAELDCHHYGPFKLNIVDTTTEKMKVACNLLDSGDVSRDQSIEKVKRF